MTRISIIALLISVVGISCINQETSVIKEQALAYDWSQVVTVGGHSFIPLPIDLYTISDEDKALKVLGTLESFEKDHPDIEVISWRISQDFLDDADDNDAADGIWVDHRPRNQ